MSSEYISQRCTQIHHGIKTARQALRILRQWMSTKNVLLDKEWPFEKEREIQAQYSDGLFMVEDGFRGDEVMLRDKIAKEKKFTYIGPFTDGCAWAKGNHVLEPKRDYRLIDRNGNLRIKESCHYPIPCPIQDGFTFGLGFDHTDLIDVTTGEVIEEWGAEQRLKHAKPCGNGWWLIQRKNDFTYTYFHPKTNECIGPFDNASTLCEGFATAKNNGQNFYLNSDFQNAFGNTSWHELIGNFSEGKAVVPLQNNKFQYIDTTGQPAFEKTFDEANAFHHGFAVVCTRRKWFYINHKGEGCFGPFDNAFDFTDDGFAVVEQYGENFHINTRGERLNDRKFKQARSFYEQRAAVLTERGWRYIDTHGNFISEQTFDVAKKFSEGRARVAIKNKLYFITREGKILSTPPFAYADDFHNGTANVSTDMYTFFQINRYGKKIFA